MAKNFSVENMQAMTDVLRGLENIASESVLRQAAVAGARVYLAEMKLRVPVGVVTYERKGTKIYPGFLRDNLLIAYDADVSVPGKLASYIATWSKDAFYGRFVEHGRSKMAAQPFLRPSYEAKKTAAAEAVDAVIKSKVAELMHV
ncbi:HK97 gp10 family phage protein [Caballeronia sp. LjRoot34]|uniref:HK97-gp10 family putative phage morphogenesis protein n=1 Tax=Caballeronia sp. LjRoot34 TaxID=3342325 RepID=UPI003ED0BD0D